MNRKTFHVPASQQASIKRRAIFADVTNALAQAIPVREAARNIAAKRNISEEAVRSTYRRMEKNRGHSHGNQRFTDEEEDVFLTFLETASICHRPLARADVITLISRYHEEKHPGSGWTAENWFDGFASRHKDKIRQRTIKAISTARTDPLTKEEISTWVTKFEDWMVAGGYSWPNLINVDEMRLRLGNNSSASKAIVSTSIACPGEVTGPRGQFASFIPFVTASGERILDVLVLPTRFGNLEFKGPNTSSHRIDNVPCKIVFSETGYLSDTQWEPILKEFKARWDNLHSGLAPVLILDNLGTHRTVEILTLCFHIGIRGFFLPANTTHFLQPLDDVIFANLKAMILRLFQKKRTLRNCTLRTMGAELVPITLEARNLITKETIKSAFKRTGIYPWSKEIIIKNATMNVGDTSALPQHLHPATTEFIEVFKSMSTGSAVQKVAVNAKKVVKLDKVYSFEDLRLEQQAALEAAETKRKSKEDAKESRKRVKTAKKLEINAANETKRCQVQTENGRCNAMWRSSVSWLSCSICNAFRICPVHKRTEQDTFDLHVSSHSGEVQV